ncbi:M20/M25/M40 family metallo-hydrolase [Clostridium saccharoperbutylacetonicum]|uniref:M20/M25/M40 family metallo-hydrolase n=1 Tax=Clostridium saccharoperbutylacetonicum TaxID=36745 RepID=UPI000983EDB2|nr:M20/M25/M40 family metallo-hydrolase [Clostridium saccharoperbutylacetonicum]AQR94054.1 peptidase T [Clostridium saccharoperbutylacetonicum]NSB29753.1 tripeptide aminopeptidase [Clostridium saccharoperbutylacetonicum]
MRINKERIISEFTKLVSIDSPSYSEKNMGEHIKKRLISLGFYISEDDSGKFFNGNCGNIYGFKEGDISLEPLLFCAHMDTVEPCTGKVAIVDKDGTIRSNGETILGADDYSGIAAILEALQTIEDKNISHRPIEVLFTIAEEVYCRGVKKFDFSKIKSKEAYILDLSGAVGSAAFKAPTILSFTININGKSSHAGFAPENGIHSILAAADSINSINIGRIDEETTVNIGIIEGGIATNIVPNQCVVKGEIRSYSHKKAIDVSENIKQKFIDSAEKIGATIDFQVEIHCEAYETSSNHQVIRRFEKASNELNLPTKLVETFGGSDNNILNKQGLTGLVIANAMNSCHSCEEYTTINELCNIGELTVSLMISQE